MSKSGEPTVPLYDSNGNFVGELATKNGEPKIKTSSGEEFYWDGSQWKFDDNVKVAATADVDTLTANGITGVPVWEKESGSPYTATGSNSATSINPSSLDTYDHYLIFMKVSDQASNGSNVDMQVGGDTGANYTEMTQDGATSTGQNEWGAVLICAPDSVSTAWFTLGAERGNVGMESISGHYDGTNTIISGTNSNVSWAPSQFTLSRGVDTDWEVHVWGKNA